MSEVHIALTGHRPNKLGGYNLVTPAYARLQDDLEAFIHFQLLTYNVVWGHAGLALGADTIWARALFTVQKQVPQRVKFYAEIPMMSQSKQWFKQSDISFWNHQVENCDDSTIYDPDFEKLTETERKYSAGKVLNKRNIGMVDHSDILLALLWADDRGLKSGTHNAVKYAQKQNKHIQYINPGNYFD